MATKQSKAFAEQIHRIFITTTNFDKAMDEIAERLDQHVLLESARIGTCHRQYVRQPIRYPLRAGVTLEYALWGFGPLNRVLDSIEGKEHRG